MSTVEQFTNGIINPVRVSITDTNSETVKYNGTSLTGLSVLHDGGAYLIRFQIVLETGSFISLRNPDGSLFEITVTGGASAEVFAVPKDLCMGFSELRLSTSVSPSQATDYDLYFSTV